MNTPEQKSPQTGSLAGCADNCLALALKLMTLDEFGEESTLRLRIKNLLSDMEKKAKAADFLMEDIQNAKFALVAFIDEIIVTSRWSQKQGWLDAPLQYQLFDRMDAGEEFFRRLEQLRKHPRAHAAVLEVYYYCLALGFKGFYQFHDKEKLRVLIDDLYLELQQVAGKANNLSPHGKRKEEYAQIISTGIPIWVILVAAVALGLLVYILRTIQINNAL